MARHSELMVSPLGVLAQRAIDGDAAALGALAARIGELNGAVWASMDIEQRLRVNKALRIAQTKGN